MNNPSPNTNKIALHKYLPGNIAFLSYISFKRILAETDPAMRKLAKVFTPRQWECLIGVEAVVRRRVTTDCSLIEVEFKGPTAELCKTTVVRNEWVYPPLSEKMAGLMTTATLTPELRDYLVENGTLARGAMHGELPVVSIKFVGHVNSIFNSCKLALFDIKILGVPGHLRIYESALQNFSI
jgi:hypothetical protein